MTGGDGVGKRAHEHLLPDEVIEHGGAVFPCKYAIFQFKSYTIERGKQAEPALSPAPCDF